MTRDAGPPDQRPRSQDPPTESAGPSAERESTVEPPAESGPVTDTAMRRVRRHRRLAELSDQERAVLRRYQRDRPPHHSADGS